MEHRFYSAEKNVQILVALLKANGIKKIVASPGTTNYTFVGSLQNDPFFEIYSSVDERSAAYMACGLAGESGEPVVLTCTGATASRNYYPGLTEAFYRKLPVLAVTGHGGTDRIGQLMSQQIDRRRTADDIALLSVELPYIHDDRDFDYCMIEANKALQELKRNGGGPVHINLFTRFSMDFSVKELPFVRAIKRIHAWEQFPEIPKGKIAVYIGSHRMIDKELETAIDNFCATYDAVVIADHTSGYYGKYHLLPTLAFMQKETPFPLEKFDLFVHIGEISAAVFAYKIPVGEVWRVSEDGEFRDPFKKLTKVFQTSELSFFNHYASSEGRSHGFFDKCVQACATVYQQIPELPFSNIWSAMQLSKRLPKGSLLHLSASNTRRCWNMFPLPDGVECASNVGCCGIDGATSSLVGASLANPHRLCFLATGDLAFFYDLNVLGNRHVGRNIRILLVNNGVGAEFKLSHHNCFMFGDDANPYMAAMGHFGNKSHELVKHFVQDLGFKYLSANNKEEYLSAVDEFTSSKSDKSIVMEIFTNHEDENHALELITHITHEEKTRLDLLKSKIKGVLKK